MNAKTMLLIGATTLSIAMTASEASAAAPVRSTNRGSNATLNLSSESTAVCSDGSTSPVFTSVQVTARQNVMRGGRNTASVAEMVIFVFNSCDAGSFTTAFGSVDNPTYSQRQASSATVAGSIPLFDSNNGMPLGTASISLSFTASGNPTKSTFSSRDVFGNVTIIQRSTGSFADATATGSVTLNGENLLTSAHESFAQLGDNTSGTVIFTRNTK